MAKKTTNINLKEKDFEFLRCILEDEEIALKPIAKELELTKWKVQRTYDKLEDSGMITSKKEGRERMVKLTNSGIYFLKWYLKKKNAKSKDKG